MAIILIIVALFSVNKQKSLLEYNSRELKSAIVEAAAIREDLAGLLENSVEISRLIVDNIDGKIAAINNVESFIPNNQSLLALDSQDDCKSQDIHMVEFGNNAAAASRLKVYELARELNMNSKSLITLLQDMGYKISHHMNFLDDNLVRRVKEELLLAQTRSNQNLARSDSAGQHLVLVSKQEPNSFEGMSNYQGEDNSPANNSIDFSLDELKLAHPYLAVHTLCERGYSVQEIAKMLDRGQGEINLILNLGRKKQACI